MNRLLTFRIIIATVFLTFISCSKDSDDPAPQETEITVSTSDFSITMDENPINGQVIGSVQGSTNDGSVTFSITEQTPSGAFSIDASSGELKVADETLFDFESNPTITGTVQVANGAVSENASITITLNDLMEENVYEGDLILRSQQEVNDFGANNYAAIIGTLHIGDPEEGTTTDIIDLSPLQSLRSINGDLGITNNPSLISTLGLNIHYLYGKLIIVVNDTLEKIEGFNRLTSVQELVLSLNPRLYDLSGLYQLTSIGDGLVLVSCPQISNLDWLSNLTSFGGDLTIINCNSLANIDGLSNLTTATGEYNYFRITYNNSLLNLNGIENLNTEIYHLEIAANSSLTSIEGLQNKRVTTTLKIIENPFLENLHGLESTINISHELTVQNNNSLINIQGLRNLETAESFQIFNNESLPNLVGLNNLERCRNLDIRGNNELTDFCDLQNLFINGSNNSYIAIYNAYNPTKQDIIDGNCSL
ncbi:cadherin repeat domain-containing protein [Aequorivita marisscotiae]|uniref:Cadherin repeat domain-containing protein n=1 Tax=Aequorivita marisscotiae TaxID=3040348 RepID=A0ABY8KT43_9FLAO|nr:cadherin repeat domain-containing protein [Aequorivita sp. Ant34-E75]WGF92610.1 cadherin repeat domain-containing protein [Aequorivita sp. Ant34-E75]